MRRHLRTALLIVVVVAAGSDAVAGQQAAAVPRGQIEIDGAYRVTSDSFTDTASPTINVEPASITTTYDVPGGFAFSGSGAIRVWKNLSVGLGVSRYSATTDAAITGSIPHPFLFSQPRSIEGTTGVTREELNVTLQLRGVFPISQRMIVSVFGGPAFISMSQDIVTDVDYTESYPYDTATFSNATVVEQSESKTGIGVGGDVAYYFSRQIGAGIGFRYSGGTIELPGMNGGTIESKVGGIDLAFGLRVRF